MRISLAHIIVGLAVIASLVALVWFIRLLIRRENYTRERFAFAALAGFVGLSGTVLSCLAHKETPWGAISNMVLELLGKPAPPEPPRLADHVLMILVLIIVSFFLSRLYKGWDGAISVRQFEKERFHERTSLVIEGFREARRIARREAPLDIYKPEQYDNFTNILESPDDTLAWHVQARDLLSLRSPSYAIDRNNDWHEEAKCWIGFNRRSSAIIAVRCDTKDISAEDLKRFVSYVDVINAQKPNSIKTSGVELVVAIRHSSCSYPQSIGEQTIKVETEGTLLDGLVDFSDYYDAIKSRVEHQTLPDSAITISDVYTSSSVRSESSDLQVDLESCLRSWLEEPGQKQLALLGEYGQGKSTAALMTAYHLLTDTKLKHRVPVLVELRGKSPRHMTPEEILAAWAVPYRISAQAVMKLLIAGRIFLILEGFDEMALIGDSEARLAHFRTLWKFSYPKAKILITGRPNFFLDDREMKAALGIAKTSAAGPYCEALTLQPFGLSQIISALRATSAKTGQEIVSLAQRDNKFQEIVSRASLLYVVSQLWEREKLYQYAGRITSAFVMELFIQHSYRRQSEKAFNSPQFMVLNESERKYFMSGIAAYMVACNLPNQIDRGNFDKAVKALYDVAPDSVSLYSSGLLGDQLKPLRKRLSDREDPLEDVSNDVRSSGILVVDESKPGALRFAHKSFMEYLAAEVYYSDLSLTNRELSAALMKATLLSASNLVRHPESVSFLAELLMSVATSSKQSLRSHATSRQLFDLIVVKSFGGGIFGKFKGWVALRALKDYASRSMYKSPSAWLINFVFWESKLGLFMMGMIAFAWLLVHYHFVLFIYGVLLMAAMSLYSMFTRMLGTLVGPEPVELWYVCCSVANLAEEDVAEVTGRNWIRPLSLYVMSRVKINLELSSVNAIQPDAQAKASAESKT